MKFLALAALCACGAAYAGPLAFTPTNIVDSVSGITETMGWGLTLSNSVTIAALDYYDPAGVSLAASHQVGIWDFSLGTLLVSATVPSGAPGTTNGVYESIAIAPFVLPAGNYIVGAGITANNDKYIFTAGTSNVQPGVAAGNSFVGAGTFVFPNQTFQSQGNFYLANFEIGSAAPSSAPEPSTWMTVAGAGGIALALRRYKSRVARR